MILLIQIIGGQDEGSHWEYTNVYNTELLPDCAFKETILDALTNGNLTSDISDKDYYNDIDEYNNCVVTKYPVLVENSIIINICGNYEY